jgi:genome maintenance exonuclease 1
VFTHTNQYTPLDLKVIEGPKGRFYITPEGNKYPSITTVLGAKDKPWLTEWRNSLGEQKADKETKRTAQRGTAVHAMIEAYLQNEEVPANATKLKNIPIALNDIAEFNSTKLFLKKINNIALQESPLYSDVLKVAGRVDCIAEYDGVLSVLDFKTSTNSKTEHMAQDYFLQTAGYALMFHEQYNVQIDQLVIIMTVEKGAVPLVFRKQVADYFEPLCERINTYHTLQGAK